MSGRTASREENLNTADMGASYDSVPYQSQRIPQSHPHRLYAVARLHGLVPPLLGGARVLELGCAAGGNLLPLARELPTAQFVGVDLSHKQIETAVAAAADDKLDNVELIAADMRELADRAGEPFDYIIAHGLYSWVPLEVQAVFLPVIAALLGPDGVAFVSYNTYPGWHQRQVVRQLMLRHTKGIDDPAKKAEQARVMLDVLVRTREGEYEPYDRALREEQEKAAELSDPFLLHDLMEWHNHPRYVGDFLADAAAAGLAYINEVNVGAGLAEFYPPAVQQVLSSLPDRAAREQFMDFWRNRSFRETLLCHADKAPQEGLDWSVIENMRLATGLRVLAGVDGKPGERFFAMPDGENRIGIQNRAAVAALDQLIAAAPGSVAFRDLALGVGDADAIKGLATDLFLRNLLTLSPGDGG